MKVVIDARMLMHSGIGRYIRNLLLNLPRDGGAAEYAALVNANNGGLADDKARLKIRRVRFNIPVYSIREQTLLPLEVRALRPDVIHYPSFNMPLLTGHPFVVTIHDLIYFLNRDACPGIAAYGYAQVMFRAVAAMAAKVIAVSEHTKRDIVGRLGIRPEKVAVIYNGVEGVFKPVSDAKKLNDTRGRYGIGGDYILYVGNHGPNKNLVRLISAFSRMKGGAQLIIAGKIDKRRAALYSAPAELGIEDRVIFPGSIPEDDLPALYSMASMFVFPSLYEGFGFPPLEAMACGAPVVSSNASSLPEVIGDAGIMVPPEDTGALSKAMDMVLSDRGLRSELREKGLKRAGLFRWEDAAEKTLAVYREALA